jgi:cytochrome b561
VHWFTAAAFILVAAAAVVMASGRYATATVHFAQGHFPRHRARAPPTSF